MNIMEKRKEVAEKRLKRQLDKIMSLKTPEEIKELKNDITEHMNNYKA